MHTSQSGAYHIFDGIARLVLVALFTLLPVFIIPMPWAAIAQGKMLLVVFLSSVTLLAWICARLLEGSIRLPRSALLYVVALLPIAYLISTMAAGWVGSALVGQGVEQDTLAAVAVWFSICAIVALLLQDNQAAQRLSIQGFAVGLTALTAFQTLYLFFPAWFSLTILSGTTANIVGSWHDVGILSGLGLFVALALWRSTIFVGVRRMVLVALGVLSAFLLVVVHFQDVFWATGALTLIGSIVALRAALRHGFSYTHTFLQALPWIVITLLLMGGALFGTGVWDKLPTRISVSQTEVRPSWQGTFDIAKQSLQAPSEFVFGSGPNSFIREWGLHKPVSVNTTPFWDSDFNFGVGIIPTSVFTAGFFGLLAWGGILLVLLAFAVRFARSARPLAFEHDYSGFALASASYLIAYHMIYTPGTAVTGTLFIILGLLIVAVAGDSPAHTLRLGVHSLQGAMQLVVVVSIVVVALIASLLIGREIISNMYVNSGAYVYQQSGSLDGASVRINRALAISPRNDRAHRAAAELGVLQLSKLIAETKADDAAAKTKLQEALQATIQHGLTAVSINEASYQNWLLLAQVYSDLAGANVEGSFAAASNAYQKAFEANPTNPVPKLRLAQLAALQGNRENARKYLNEAIALKPDFAAAHFLLSQVEAADGKGEAAVAAASNAVQLVQSDPLGWFNLGYILYAGQAYRDAALSLQQAVSLAPDYSNALFYLALSYNALQMPQDAVIALERVAALNPNETSIPIMIANLKAGKDISTGLAPQAQTPAKTN